MTYAGMAYAGALYGGWAMDALAPPGVPTNTQATANGNNTITTTWEPPDGDQPVEWYEVSVDGGTSVNVGLDQTYTTGGVTSGTHTVWVRACNEAGCSAWVEVSATTLPGVVACPCGNPVN